jgi:tetratricopeptide (TPR) repeat protein
LLRKGVERALALKLIMRDRREVFDEVQQQVNGEAYLFLAKALTALGRYDEAIAACDEGLSFTKHNLLRVQRRVTERAKNGESPNADDTAPVSVPTAGA